MENKSLRYEFEFIHYFNNKKFGELSKKWQKHLKRMFPNINKIQLFIVPNMKIILQKVILT